MIRNLLVILLFISTISLFGCSKNSDKIQSKETKIVTQNEQTVAVDENKAPNFSLVDTKGKKISLSDYKGKVVIVDFWATWCPPCRRSVPDLIAIQKKYEGKVVIIGISLDIETKGDVPGFIKNFGINYPVVYGTNKVVQEYGGIQAIPTSFIIDQKGDVVRKYIGLTPKSIYISEIKKLLGES